MIIEHLNKHQKEYIEDTLECHDYQLNYKNFDELKFSSVNTKNIELIIGQDEFVTLSMLIKKEDLNKYNIISIYEPEETILPNELYTPFNSHLILIFSDIRHDIDKMLENNKIDKEKHSFLSNLEIQNKQLDLLKEFIIDNKDKKFIINCHAGISRSSAIGYILEDILNESLEQKIIEQEKIISHWRYSPNKIIIEKFTNNEFNNKYDDLLDLDNIF